MPPRNRSGAAQKPPTYEKYAKDKGGQEGDGATGLDICTEDTREGLLGTGVEQNRCVLHISQAFRIRIYTS